MSRTRRMLLIGLGVVLFLLVSAVLARFLTAENRERDAEYALLRAQAAGDERGMLSRLPGCRTSTRCLADVRANASALRRPGPIGILNLKSRTAYSLTAARGLTRLAWSVPGRLPVVQCVTVRREGDLLTGISVTLIALSRPIPGMADC